MCIRDRFDLNKRRLKKLANPEKKKKELVPISENKSAQMMFKTALRNHLDLSSLADNKANIMLSINAVSYTHLRAHETVLDLVCRLLLEKNTQQTKKK